MTSPPPRGHTPPRPRRSTSKTTRTPPRRTPSLRSQPWERYGSSALARGDSGGPNQLETLVYAGIPESEYSSGPTHETTCAKRTGAPKHLRSGTQEHGITSIRVLRTMGTGEHQHSSTQEQENTYSREHQRQWTQPHGITGTGTPLTMGTRAYGRRGTWAQGNMPLTMGTRAYGRRGTWAHGNSDAPDHGNTGLRAQGNMGRMGGEQ